MALCPTPASTTPDWFPLRWQPTSPAQPCLRGHSPLPWWCGDWYSGPLRTQLLARRRDGAPVDAQQPLAALVAGLGCDCLMHQQHTWMLVPIPCRPGGTNTVPMQLAAALAEVLNWPMHPELLLHGRRRRPQHWLGRQQRWRNAWHSFRALLNSAPTRQQMPLLLVDDVLTSGATALAARTALQEAGWKVAGIACLARTPRSGRG